MITPLRLGLVIALTAPLASATPATADNLRFGPCPANVVHAGAAQASAHTAAGGPVVECAELPVPLEYAVPNGRQVSIAVSRVKASGTPPEYRGALLVNPGGPGGAGLDYAAAKRAKMPESVQRSYDIIGFDPRGVGHSDPIDCGPLGGLFQHPGPEPVPTSTAEERAYLDRLHAMSADCRQHTGAALPHINTTNTARDMDRIRQTLGEPRLNFLGISYGTYLGAAYAALFPERVGRIVLDSAVSPDRWHDFDLQQGFAMLEQRDVLFRWIAARPSLGLGSTPEAVRTHYLQARSSLAEHSARATFGPSEFDHLVYRTLSRTERWEPFARALSGYVHTGNVDGLTPELPETDPESRNYESALRTVKCADSPRPSTPDVIGAVRALRARDPQPIMTGLEAATCRYWPQPGETARLGHPAMRPVLLVQASHDPTTPYPGAKRMQLQLPGSRMITLHNSYSHGVFASQRNPCVDTTTATYLTHGTLPPDDLACWGPGLPDSGNPPAGPM